MTSTIGNLLRRVADDCDRSCGGVSSEDFEKVAKLQLKDHDDIKALMTSVLILKRQVDDLQEKSKKNDKCKVVKLHGQDPV